MTRSTGRCVTARPATAVDWSQVDIWWGDERFLPHGDPQRNETQARAALLDALALDPARVHPMPASDGPDGDDPEGAAARYAEELAQASQPARLPYFDLLMLGVGEDGHVASTFPEHPAAYDTRPVTAVRGSPKPPPVRITLTLPTLNKAAEVWLIATGAEKAQVVGIALSEREKRDTKNGANAKNGASARCRAGRDPFNSPPPGCTGWTAPSGYSTGPPLPRSLRRCAATVKRSHRPPRRSHRQPAAGHRQTRYSPRRALRRCMASARMASPSAVTAALLHVREMRLVGLYLGSRRRIRLVLARRQPTAGAVPQVRDGDVRGE